MRTEKSIKNVIVAFISNFSNIIIGFISQAIFIKYLGEEYLGLNGLFSNLVSMLGIVELGLGSALIYHLYEPIAKKSIDEIKSLMQFYKKSYNIIALIITILGLLITPFLNFFVETSLNVNIYIIFILFIIDIVFSYLLSYKRSILYGNQENYIVNAIHILYTLFMNISQIIVLIYSKNYFYYLIIKIISRILENIIITYIANKKYPYIKDKNAKKLDNEIKKDVFKKVKGLFLHKIGSYLVLGTDNIIISKFINLITVGIYSNYALISNGIKNLFSQIYYSITASVGNLLIEKEPEKSYDIYQKMLFMNYWLACFCSISFFIISKPFVTVWLGKNYILNNITVFFLMIQLFLDIFGYTIGSFKTGAGIFHEDRWIPLLQSIINIVVSVILVKSMGLTGVIIGTIVSQLLLYTYSYPKYVYEPIFKRNKLKYYKEMIQYLLLFLMTFTITVLLTKYININNSFIELIIYATICIIIPNIITILLFFRSKEFKYFINLIKSKIKKISVNK